MLGPLRRRPSLWLTLVRQFTKHILVSLYFFIGSGYEHIYFILGAPGIVLYQETVPNYTGLKCVGNKLPEIRLFKSLDPG